MPSWSEILAKLQRHNEVAFLKTTLFKTLRKIKRLRNNRHVIYYASAFIQKSSSPPETIMLTKGDLDGFMAAVHQMDCSMGLVILLHTPGGELGAVQPIVEYLHSKFSYIETVVPTYAMSAGTMIALSGDKIIMGRQSQLGPIDPQMILPNGVVSSADSVIKQFERAIEEIEKKGTRETMLAWTPVITQIGPLYQEALNVMQYSKKILRQYLESRMFKNKSDASTKAQQVADYFGNVDEHLNHGQRINKEKAKNAGVLVEDLEENQDLQDAVLTAHHLISLIFERTPATKLIVNDLGKLWARMQVVQTSR